MLKKIIFFPALFIAVILIYSSSFAETTPKKENKSLKNSTVLDISSDQLEIFKNKGIAVFQGNVEFIKEDMVMNSDILYIKTKKLEEDKKIPEILDSFFLVASYKDISELTAEGNLSIKLDNNNILKSKKLSYNIKSGILEMKDDVTMVSDKNILKGDFLTYNLNTNKVKVFSSKEKDSSVRGSFIKKLKK